MIHCDVQLLSVGLGLLHFFSTHPFALLNALIHELDL